MLQRPNVHEYHDYRRYLADWFAFKRKTEKLSLREFSRRAGLSKSFLSLILNGKRTLTEPVMEQILAHMDLIPTDAAYFKTLRRLGESQNSNEQSAALQKLQNSKAYRRLNPKEFEVYRYFSRWQHIVIREMAGLQHFKLDAQWIRERLPEKLTLKQVQDAIDFLLKFGYIQKMGESDAGFAAKDSGVQCEGAVYRLALSDFHKKMLTMAAESIHSVPREERNLLSYTIGMSPSTFEKTKAIMEKAMEEIRALSATAPDRDAIYHVGFVAFPVVRGPKT